MGTSLDGDQRMLNSDEKWFLAYLGAGYLATLEFLSWATSTNPVCLLVSQRQPANQPGGTPVCAPLHEGISRALVFLWNNTTHDSITAGATVVIAIFTLTLWWSTRGLLRANEIAIRAARDEFIWSIRPRMRLKHIWFTYELGDIWQGSPIEVRLDVVNVGDGGAIVSKFNYMTLVVPDGVSLPQRPPYNETDELETYAFQARLHLPSGVTATRHFCDGRTLSPEEVAAIRRGSVHLYFIGTIEYWDDAALWNNTLRLKQTAFCRYLTFEHYPPTPDDFGRFQISADLNYEFQD